MIIYIIDSQVRIFKTRLQCLVPPHTINYTHIYFIYIYIFVLPKYLTMVIKALFQQSYRASFYIYMCFRCIKLYYFKIML